LQFTNGTKFEFGKAYPPSDSNANTAISDRFARQDGVENRDKVYLFIYNPRKEKNWKITTNKKEGLSVLLVKMESCEVLIFAHWKLLSDGHVSTSG